MLIADSKTRGQFECCRMFEWIFMVWWCWLLIYILETVFGNGQDVVRCAWTRLSSVDEVNTSLYSVCCSFPEVRGKERLACERYAPICLPEGFVWRGGRLLRAGVNDCLAHCCAIIHALFRCRGLLNSVFLCFCFIRTVDSKINNTVHTNFLLVWCLYVAKIRLKSSTFCRVYLSSLVRLLAFVLTF